MRKVRLKLYFFIYICFFVLSACNVSPIISKENVEVIDGVLDLTNWDWEQDGIISLDGEWEFYWDHLLTPEELRTNEHSHDHQLLTVPRLWNNHIIEGEKLSGIGYATYRLFIKTSSDEILGLKLPKIFTAYNLWVNNELVASYESVTLDNNENTRNQYPRVKFFKTESDTIEIVIQVANYRHRSGGIAESLQLGTDRQINNLSTKNIAFDLFLFGCLFISGIYHLAFFMFRTKDKSNLYLGIFSLLISVRTLFSGEIFFLSLFPYFHWEMAHKVYTLAYYLAVPLFFSLLNSLFPNDTSQKINRFIYIFSLSFALLVVLTPTTIFTYVNPAYQLFTLAVFPYILYILYCACDKKREGSSIIAAGSIILILFAINDILFLSVIMMDSGDHFLKSFITRGNLTSWGLFIFIIAHSLVLAKKFYRSFSAVELLTEQLQELNENLESTVKERTHALQVSNKKLEKAYEDVSRSEKARQDLIQNISHDLRTPLTAILGYVNAILDGVVSNEDKQRKYLTRVTEKVSSINYMVQELMNLSQLQARQLKLNLKPIEIKVLIENISEKYDLDMANTNVNFKINDLRISNGAPSFVLIDNEKLDRVFTNLLSNALKFTPKGGHIEISFDIAANKKDLLITISDNGAGIPQDELPYIFERFYKVSKARQESTKSHGLGLAIAKEIVDYHEGTIWAESKINEGSYFFFTLPMYNESEIRGRRCSLKIE